MIGLVLVDEGSASNAYGNFVLTIPTGLSTNITCQHQTVVVVATLTNLEFWWQTPQFSLGESNQNINRDNVNQQIFLGADVPVTTHIPMKFVSHAF